MVAERLLQRRELAVFREPLDRLDRRPVGLDGEQHAALHERAVDDHRAGAAVAGVAADVAAGQVEVVANEMDEQLPRLDLALVGRAVDRDRDRPGGRDRAQSQLLAWLTARTARTSARWLRYSLEACTSEGGSRFAARTASRTASASAELGCRTTGTASTQPSAIVTPPFTDAAADEARSLDAEGHGREAVGATGRDGDLRQDFADPDGRHVDAEEELQSRDAALAARARDRHLRAERSHQRGQVVRRVARTEVPADRPAVPHLHVGDLRAHRADDRPRARFTGLDELGVCRHGANLERSVGAQLNAFQLFDRREIDQRIRRAGACFHDVDQRLPAREGCAVIGGEQLDRFSKRSRPRISDLTEEACLHVL